MPILPLILAAAPAPAPLWEMVPPVADYAAPCPLPAAKWGTKLSTAPVQPASNDVHFGAGGQMMWNGLPINDATLRRYMEKVVTFDPRPTVRLYGGGVSCAELRRVAALIDVAGPCTPHDCVVLPGTPPPQPVYMTVSPPPPRPAPPQINAYPPAPPPPPRPGNRPTPRGSPQSWVTDDDYPAAAVRPHIEGVTAFTLSIDAEGKVVDCTVTASSGAPMLDDTTCALLTRRARFNPARGPDGTGIAASWSSRFRWELPSDESPLLSWSRITRYRVDPSGKVSQCEMKLYGPVPDVLDMCVGVDTSMRDPRGAVWVELRDTHLVDGTRITLPPATAGRTLFRRDVRYTIDSQGKVAGCRVISETGKDTMELSSYACHPGLVYAPGDVARNPGRGVIFIISATVTPEKR